MRKAFITPRKRGQLKRRGTSYWHRIQNLAIDYMTAPYFSDKHREILASLTRWDLVQFTFALCYGKGGFNHTVDEIQLILQEQERS